MVVILVKTRHIPMEEVGTRDNDGRIERGATVNRPKDEV